ELEVGADGGELARQLQGRQPRAQVLADLAGHFGDMGNEVVNTAELLQQPGAGFRADLVDARDVVRTVADQGEVVDDLLRINIELGLNAIAVQQRVVHGVDQRYGSINQLRHILVTGGNEHRLAGLGGTAREG